MFRIGVILALAVPGSAMCETPRQGVYVYREVSGRVSDLRRSNVTETVRVTEAGQILVLRCADWRTACDLQLMPDIATVSSQASAVPAETPASQLEDFFDIETTMRVEIVHDRPGDAKILLNDGLAVTRREVWSNSKYEMTYDTVVEVSCCVAPPSELGRDGDDWAITYRWSEIEGEETSGTRRGFYDPELGWYVAYEATSRFPTGPLYLTMSTLVDVQPLD